MPPELSTNTSNLAKAIKARCWLNPPVLRSERAADFRALVGALTREIKPSGIIEEMYVSDIAWLVWEINRLRRCRTPIINASYRAALEDVLTNLISNRGEAHLLSLNWFAEDGKEKVREILSEFDLDDAVIDAEAVRRSSRDLEGVDKLLIALEARRDKTLACIAHYRTSFARQLRKSSDLLIEAQATDVPCLKDETVKTSPD